MPDRDFYDACREEIRREIIEEGRHKTTAEKHAFAKRLGINISYLYRILRTDFRHKWQTMKGTQGPRRKKK